MNVDKKGILIEVGVGAIILVGLVAILMSLFVGGCASKLDSQKWEQVKEAIAIARETAKEQNVSWKVTAKVGEPMFVQKIGFGLEDGFVVEAHFQGNAGSNESDTPAPDQRGE